MNREAQGKTRMAQVGSPILFLDFDGVLHRDGAPVDELFCKIPVLEQALRRCPDVDVVISSSWREVHPLDEIQEYFSPDIGARIIGATPVRPALAEIPTQLWSFVREAECVAWITENRPATSWIALDDQAWRFRPFSPNLILVNGALGLTEDLAHLMVSKLLADKPHHGG